MQKLYQPGGSQTFSVRSCNTQATLKKPQLEILSMLWPHFDRFGLKQRWGWLTIPMFVNFYEAHRPVEVCAASVQAL
jgi:hypothetical protein